jgi:pimeloyl-ACP methyl ester carboxylesterase
MLSGTVLVPGITTVASVVFAPFVKKLESIGVRGFSPLDIPSVNPAKPLVPSAFDADVAAIRAALTEAIDRKGLDVVLFGHSYGAAPCLAAARGLWKSVREREGKKGGVAKVAMIAAPLILTGESVGGLRQEYEKLFGAVEGPPPEFERTDLVRSDKMKGSLII